MLHRFLAQHALRHAGALGEAIVLVYVVLPPDPDGAGDRTRPPPAEKGARARQGIHAWNYASRPPPAGIRKATEGGSGPGRGAFQGGRALGRQLARIRGWCLTGTGRHGDAAQAHQSTAPTNPTKPRDSSSTGTQCRLSDMGRASSTTGRPGVARAFRCARNRPPAGPARRNRVGGLTAAEAGATRQYVALGDHARVAPSASITA